LAKEKMEEGLEKDKISSVRLTTKKPPYQSRFSPENAPPEKQRLG
jgi:hypothetical protein